MFDQLLKDLRRDASLGVRELARLVDTSPSHISRLESGEVNPSTELMARLARVMGVPDVALFWLGDSDFGAPHFIDRTQELRRLTPSWTDTLEADLQATLPGLHAGGKEAKDHMNDLLTRLARMMVAELSLVELVESYAGEQVAAVVASTLRLTPARLALLAHQAADQAALSELDRRESKATAGSIDSLIHELQEARS